MTHEQWSVFASLALAGVGLVTACADSEQPSREGDMPASAAGSAGAAAAVPRAGEAGDEPDPLVGSWSGAAEVPARVAVTLTFGADGAMLLDETVAPLTTPAISASSMRSTCVVRNVISAQYSEQRSGGASVLSWTLLQGDTNVISGCADPSQDHPGTPIAANSIADFIASGYVPPTTFSYVLDRGILVINPEVIDTKTADGLRGRTHFQRLAR